MLTGRAQPLRGRLALPAPCRLTTPPLLSVAVTLTAYSPTRVGVKLKLAVLAGTLEGSVYGAPFKSTLQLYELTVAGGAGALPGAVVEVGSLTRALNVGKAWKVA